MRAYRHIEAYIGICRIDGLERIQTDVWQLLEIGGHPLQDPKNVHQTVGNPIWYEDMSCLGFRVHEI